MGKKKQDKALSGKPIAEKLLAKVKQHRRGKVVNIREVIDGRAMAEALDETTVTSEELAGLEPAHAAYVYAQNQVSVMAEQLLVLDEMAPFARIISKAEDLYMPSAPPMSPLTTSYFTCWAIFDACAGPADETIGTIVSEFAAAFGAHTEMLRLIRMMQESRMGLYIHQGRDGKLVVLEDLITRAVFRAIVPAGYGGQKGELWYARVLPPPVQDRPECVVITTPYVLLDPGLQDWLEYFNRTFPETAQVDAYERYMKYGPTREYWNDFIFEAYVNHRQDAIYLAGLPDIPESRPHSVANR